MTEDLEGLYDSTSVRPSSDPQYGGLPSTAAGAATARKLYGVTVYQVLYQSAYCWCQQQVEVSAKMSLLLSPPDLGHKLCSQHVRSLEQVSLCLFLPLCLPPPLSARDGHPPSDQSFLSQYPSPPAMIQALRLAV